MSNDPILGMTKDEIFTACWKVLGEEIAEYPMIVGLIIEKLREWGISVQWRSSIKVWIVGMQDQDPSLQVAFLRTAQALGKWEPPKKVEERRYYRKDGEVAGPFFHDNHSLEVVGWERVTVTPYKDNL